MKTGRKMVQISRESPQNHVGELWYNSLPPLTSPPPTNFSLNSCKTPSVWGSSEQSLRLAALALAGCKDPRQSLAEILEAGSRGKAHLNPPEEN